ncbi:hypothetical protein H2200_007611 [Cladophialophora chaetospira]|uniref:Prion-inhibition and propagation HeLo domain-containing protein n=1 Tax=Cladophialophora chaetospira TaxID=386627 RepID=A0AA38X679_9EURO|nr:hypothetical protein H2200_007611 [Cladophialophora chaetospira]
MAEVSGLVIGAVALASLFNTCVDLFERFELARDYAYDYDLACTKLRLLEVRLTAWGVFLNVEIPGREHPALRQRWTEEKDVIGRSLLGVRDIFQNATELAERYKLTPKCSRSSRFLTVRRSRDAQPFADDLKAPKATVKHRSFLQRRTLWAIHDKQKLDVLIQDLSFLIENLEKVTERMNMSSTEEVAHIRAEKYQEWLKQQLPAHNARERPGEDTTTSLDSTQAKNQDVNLEKMVENLDGNLYTGKQTVNGLGVMGNVGNKTRRHVYTGDQDINEGGFGVLGDVESDFGIRRQHDGEPPARR